MNIKVSHRANKPITNPPFSAIRDHSHKLDHSMREGSFKILDKSQSEEDLVIMENLYIYLHKPKLCNMERSTDLLCF